jgi:threonine synthase
MRYVSTRGRAPIIGFSEVLLSGLAPDGGLYLPESIPSLPSLGDAADYAEAAFAVTRPFVEPDIDGYAWGGLLEKAYARFDLDEVAPLVEMADGNYLLELFHGPTFAFKDMAMQVLGDLFEFELARRGETLTVIMATSGDTGAAAVEALADRDGIELFILHPDGGVSEIQRRQMTTCTAANVHNLAIDGSFDDCQDAVKAMFADEEFRAEHRLGAVNSINWARVMMQVAYYAIAIARLGGPATFSVPTGNFGNVYAGHVARQMGTDITGLIVASNRNDILTRFHTEAVMEIREVVKTTSPSMDIQISSNFERFVFESLGRDGQATDQFMTEFRSSGSITDERVLAAYRADFEAASLTDAEAAAIIEDLYRDQKILVDPHTAVGLGAARRLDPDGVTVSLATAHPAKFGDAIIAATGEAPSMPPKLASVMEAPERMLSLPNELKVIKETVGSGRKQL